MTAAPSTHLLRTTYAPVTGNYAPEIPMKSTLRTLTHQKFFFQVLRATSPQKKIKIQNQKIIEVFSQIPQNTIWPAGSRPANPGPGAQAKSPACPLPCARKLTACSTTAFHTKSSSRN